MEELDMDSLMGFFVVMIIVGVVAYVFSSLAHMKALKALGYENAWLAWIPYGNYYGYADAVSQGEKKVMLFGKVGIPALLFKLWWILPLALGFVLERQVYTVIARLLNIVFLGYTYTRMYARIEGKTEEETTLMGCVSGLLPIIAAIKFITLK